MRLTCGACSQSGGTAESSAESIGESGFGPAVTAHRYAVLID